MRTRDYGFTFDDEPVFTHIRRDVPQPPASRLDEEFFVFVMGPYTAFDATYAFADGDRLETPFIDDPLFDRESHVTGNGCGSFKTALEDLCESYRTDFGVHAFLATDVSIPTKKQARDGEPSMSVLDQSIAFAAVSDAVVFVFSEAGLTTGVGSEVGAILGEFHLRKGNPEPIRKPRERFRIFKTDDFSSASINEIPSTYDVDTITFESKSDLLTKTRHFLANLERRDLAQPVSIFNPYSGHQ